MNNLIEKAFDGLMYITLGAALLIISLAVLTLDKDFGAHE